MTLRITSFFLCSLIFGATLHAQNSSFHKFNHLNQSTGFPADFVYSMELDEAGYIWALTSEGLIRFNGHSGKKYRATNDTTGPLKSRAYGLFTARDGNIWISYDTTAISRFNPKTEVFEHFAHQPNNPKSFPKTQVAKICEDKQGNIWIPTWGNGLLKFNAPDHSFLQYIPKEENTLDNPAILVTSITEDRDGTLLVCTWEEESRDNFLFVFDPIAATFKKFTLQGYSFENEVEYNKILEAFRIIHFIEIDYLDNLWVGTFTGLFYVDRTNNTIMRVTGLDRSMLYQQGHITFDNATACLYEDENTLWVSTEVGGIMVVDLVTHNVSYLNKLVENPASLSGNIIRDMLRDNFGNIWVATEGWGLDVYSPFEQQFKVISNDALKATRQNTAQGQYAVNHHFLAVDNSTLVVSHGKGISLYNLNVNRVTHIDLQKELDKFLIKNPSYNQYIHNNINFVGHCMETSEGLLIATHMGTLYLNRRTGIIDFERIKNFERTYYDSFDGDDWHYGLQYVFEQNAPSSAVTSVELFNYNSVTKEKQSLFELPTALETGEAFDYYRCDKLTSTSLFINYSANTFLIVNPKSGSVKPYSYLPPFSNVPDTNLMVLHIQKDNRVWILGQNGLYLFNHLDGSFKDFNPSLNLGDNDRIHAVFQDKDGVIWVALRYDLIRLNPTTNETFRFGQKHGLVIGGFVKCFTPTNNSNKVILPVNYGILIFNPKKLKIDTTVREMLVSEIIIDKDTLSNLRRLAFLKSPPQLAHYENFITIEFASSQLFSAGGKSYQYRLLGLDSSWVKSGNQNKVTYTNLKPGDYCFEARSLDTFGIQSKTLQIPFTIDKPFWLKWWCIILEIFLFMLAIFLYVRLREKNLTMAKRRLELAVDVRTKEVQEKVKEIAVQNNLIRTKNKELTDSIKYAERIQSTLLAHRTVLEKNLSQPMVFFKPKDIVSGDFYWAAKQDDTFHLAICDSTGHGVPGAFMSLLNIRFLNEAIAEKNISAPNEILNHVRNRLIESVSHDGAKDGMDGTLLSYSKSTNKLCYSSAQNAPILIRNNKVIKLGADKMPIGLGENIIPFTLHNIDCQNGDAFYFYTDGFKDQFGGPKGKKLKNKNLVALLLSIHQLPAQQQEKKLDAFLTNWMGDLDQVDDILVVGMKL